MPGEKRGYVKRARAEGEARTRARILDAALSIYEGGGARETTMAAVARRAGIARGTVYRHFGSEAALLGALASKVTSDRIPVGVEVLAGISYAPERLVRALSMAYAHYRSNAALIRAIRRDGHVSRNAHPYLRALADWRSGLADLVLDALGSGSELRRPALDHALSFEAWHSLCVNLGQDDETAVRMMTAMVRAL